MSGLKPLKAKYDVHVVKNETNPGEYKIYLLNDDILNEVIRAFWSSVISNDLNGAYISLRDYRSRFTKIGRVFEAFGARIFEDL